MQSKKKVNPPAWAERILSWYCRRELFEDLSGDLREYFERNLKEKGLRRAQLNYILDVLKFCRTYTMRRPSLIGVLAQGMMIRSYFKTSGRGIVRNKLFSAINVVGLAVSMSVGLLVIAFVSDFLSYDRFHTNRKKIYRVYDRYEAPLHSIELASVSVKAAKEIETGIAGIEEIVLMRNGFAGDANIGDKKFPIGGLYASENFFDVFTFPLVSGNPRTALKEPYSLVVTEKTANRLFGSTDVLGRSIKFDTTNYTVTGVAMDAPKLSHLRFDLLISFSTAEILMPKRDPNFLSWENIWQNYIYLLLPENTDIENIQAGLSRISESQNKNLDHIRITLMLQPLQEVALGKKLENQVGPTMMPIVLWILGGLAAVIILSACFNYTNLSIARSFRRSREVGIRKVIGAQKGQVLIQFISESVLVSLIALLLAFPLYLFLRTQFLALNPHVEDIVSLHLSPQLIGWFFAMAAAVGIAAGFLPAVFYSRINSVQVLKNISTLKLFRHVSLRKVLIVVQYTISIMFISTTLIGYDQYKSFLVFDLGFSTENILNIRMQGNKGDQLKKELMEIPGIEGISKSMMITSLGSIHGTTVKYKDSKDSAMVWLNMIDENYIPLHGHVLLAGRNLQWQPENSIEKEAIVNEQVLKRFDIANRDPQKALGEVVLVDGKKLTIVGVLKDFHYGTIEKNIEPVMFRYASDSPGGYLNVKIVSNDLPATMKAIEKSWKRTDDTHPLDAKFYDDQIEEAYSQFSVMIKVIGFIAFLAVSIASFGLFGMVVFTTETRMKEISIRKVLGASEKRLIFLLSRGFIFLLITSGCIAIPVTWVFFEKVVLVNFAYHKPVGVIEIILGLGAVIVIAMLMIGLQTTKVARANPAVVLKNE